MSKRSRPLRRRKAQLEPRPRLLIICEGKVTEPSYFKGLIQAEQIRLIEVVVDNEGGTPKTLVERAVSRIKASKRQAKGARDQNLKYDEIWCVFDVDEHPKLMDALQQAKAQGISITISNPCFELWLLLHFTYHSAWIDRHAVQNACREHLKDFDKYINFSEVSNYIEVAILRAEQLEKWQETRGCSGENPSTTVHRLVQHIIHMSKTEYLKQIQELQSKEAFIR
jgi:hypothetical protein